MDNLLEQELQYFLSKAQDVKQDYSGFNKSDLAWMNESGKGGSWAEEDAWSKGPKSPIGQSTTQIQATTAPPSKSSNLGQPGASNSFAMNQASRLNDLPMPRGGFQASGVSRSPSPISKPVPTVNEGLGFSKSNQGWGELIAQLMNKQALSYR